MSFPQPYIVTSIDDALNSKTFDALVLISTQNQFSLNKDIDQFIQHVSEIDQRVGKETLLFPCDAAPGGKLILAPAGELKNDYDDVRNFGDAAKSAVTMAKNAGAINPVLVIDPIPEKEVFKNALAVAYLSACQGLWKPLEAREALSEEKMEPVKSIGLFDPEKSLDKNFLSAVESGKRLARDLCGTNPERMSPPNFAQFCMDAFKGTEVKVSVEDDRATLEKKYPLLAAVARASQGVTRHQPRVIKLEYQGKGTIEKTLLFVGKAVTYDTGGADIKTGGHMAGMSRDKGGGAAVAGFLKAVAELQPEGLKVVAYIGAVRNSVGADCYVADEIITAHSGKRVRIGNTDAEGRLVMCDLLSHMREQAKSETNPELFTIATLTGHAALTVGPYTLFVDNGPALDQKIGEQIAGAGELWGDAGETSRSRREDWKMIAPRSEADDVLSSNNGPSVSVARGHQFPMAFLCLSSGLDDHGKYSDHPIPYTHIDIAGSGVEAGDWQHDKPTAAPVTALAGRYLNTK